MQCDYSRLIQLDRFLFEKYPICFPLYEKLTIIVGPNGTGKTKLLENMYDYFIEQKEKVLYFPIDRILNITFEDFQKAWETLDGLSVMNKLSETGYDYDLSRKWSIDKYSLKLHWEMYRNNYINSGVLQAINFLTNIINYSDDVVVMIDIPERNLDMYKKRTILDDLLNLPNVKKLIVVTHCPEIICYHLNNTWDIESLCNILK